MDFIREYGGFVFSGLIFAGASGVLTPFLIQSSLIFMAVVAIISNWIWGYLHKIDKHIYFAAFFAAIYFLFGIYFSSSVSPFAPFASFFYIFSSLALMSYTISDITHNK